MLCGEDLQRDTTNFFSLMAEEIHFFRTIMLNFIWIEINLENYKLLRSLNYGKNAYYFLSYECCADL